MLKLWRSEPAAIVAIIATAVSVAVLFGAPITVEQKGAIIAFVTALGGLVTRSQVTPAPDPVAPLPPVPVTSDPPRV